MKRILIVCFLTFCVDEGFCRQAGWYAPGQSPTTKQLLDVSVLDANTVVAVGDSGAIVRTTNAGMTWSIPTSNTLCALEAVHFVNATTGWAVGTDRTILKTTDGGATWFTQSFTLTNRIAWDVFFINTTTGWVITRDNYAGYRAYLYKTTDGGASWSGSMTNVYSNLYSVRFTSATVGWMMGVSGTIIKTTDGGTNWTNRTSGTTNTLLSSCFTDAQTGYAVGYSGTILKTTDAGETWSSLVSGTASTLSSVDFVDSQNGWVVGVGGIILSTTNGGATWKSQSSGKSGSLNAVDFLNSQVGWIVGYSGTVLKTTTRGVVNNDVGVTAMEIADVVETHQSVPIKITIKNFGGIDQSNFALSYCVNNGSPVTENYVGTLLAGASASMTFTTTWSSSFEGTYRFTAWTRLTNDENNTNDTLPASRSVVVIAPTPPPPEPNGWFAQNDGSIAAKHLQSIHAIDINRLVAVGLSGAIVRTTNGGATWENVSAGTTTDLYGVHFLNSQLGWVVGYNGTMLKTTDGGNSWSTLSCGTTSTLKNVQFVDANVGWVIDNDSKIRKTTDGGISWSVQYTGSNVAFLDDIYFVNPNLGFIMGHEGSSSMLRTTDGGVTWTGIGSGGAWVRGMYFLDALHGWASGITSSTISVTLDVWGDLTYYVPYPYATLWTTVDGGVTWTQKVTSSGTWMQKVQFVDATTGWAIDSYGRSDSQNRILRTTDGGSTWTVQSSGTTVVLKDLATAGISTGWVVGGGGTILKTITGGLRWDQQRGCATSDWLLSVCFTSDQNGWGCSYAGSIVRTTNGGRSWSAFASATKRSLNSVCFVDAQTGWIAGDSGYVFKTTDGGTSWGRQVTGTTQALASVSFVDPLNGWCVGASGLVLSTTSGGAAWNSQTLSSTSLSAVQFVSSQTGWIVGSHGLVMKTINGGSTWTAQPAGSTQSFNSLHFVNGSIGWIVGNSGTVFKTTDGGSSWNAQVSRSDETLYSVSFANSSTGWTTGSNGTVLKTTDGGNAWGKQVTGKNEIMSAVHAENPTTAWVVGTNGMILKTNDGGGPLLFVPLSPALASPADSSTKIGKTVTLRWHRASDAVSCRLQVSKYYSFSPSIVDQANLTDTSLAVSGLDYGTEYFWHVQATNSSGSSAWSVRRIFTTGSAPPPIPTPYQPADGATGVGPGISLWWSYSSGAQSYHLQISTDSAFTTIVFDDSTISSTWKDVGELESLTKYYWRISAQGTLSESEWSKVWSFTTMKAPGPPKPSLVYPLDQMVGLPLSVTLRWNKSPGAVYYSVQVSTSPTFPYPGTSYEISYDTVLAVSGLSSTTTYYWCVRACDSTGESGSRAPWSFTTMKVGPLVPTLASPPDGATDISSATMLSWSSSKGATSYRLQVSLSSDFSSTVIDRSLGDTTFVLSGLSSMTTYYWRVCATDTTGSSAWVGPRNFTTRRLGPPTPTLSSPVDAAWNLSTNLVFQWNRSQGANSYRLQISSLADFSCTVLDKALADTVCSVTSLDSTSTYYWRVNATDSSGTSAWSSVRRLTIGNQPAGVPAIPSPLSPGNSATAVSINPRIQWNASTGAVSYRLQVSTASTFLALVFDDSTLKVTEKTIGPLTRNTTYYWRVSAKNGAGNCNWSPVWSFTTVPAGPAGPILSSPSQNTMDVGTSITLRWMSSEGAVSYKIQVSTSSLFSPNLIDKTLADTSYAVSALSSSTTYYWRVQAIDISGAANWSAVWSFATVGAGWRTSNVVGFFRSICFVGDRYGWMAGSSGILATTDGGAGWKSQASGVISLVSICFVDSLTGWSVGAAGKIVKTTDGGTQWTSQTSGTAIDLRDVSMSDANNGWVVSEGMILRTTNGGSTWESQTAPVMQYIYGVKALSSTKGIVFGGNLVLRTTNGGATWTSPSLPAYGFLQGAYFMDENTGWVVGADGVMFKTTDGGIQWSFVFSGTNNWITSIHFIDARQGWAVGWNGTIIKTTDGGATWGRQLSGTTSSLYGVHFIDAFKGWVVGGQNTKTFDGGGVSFFPPVLLSPSADATNTTTRPTFQWNAAAGAVSYQLQVATGSYFYSGSIVINDSALTFTTRQTSILDPNRTYYWRVLGYLIDGSALCSPVWSFKTGTSSTLVDNIAGLPGTYYLYQNYPNPFNPSTAIEFDVPKECYVTLKVHSTLGNEVATLVASTLSPGRYRLTWNAANVSTGVYFCRMQAGDFMMTKKLLLLK